MNKLRVAVIGTGMIANSAHFPALNILREEGKLVLQNENNPQLRIDLNDPNALAFDHTKIIKVGLERLKNKIEYTDLAFHLVPDEFTLTELQNVYEAILGKKLLAPAFRRVMKSRVEATGKTTSGSGHRPSVLFKYKPVEEEI